MTKIRNAGAIFIGPYSSEPLGDYFAGPNHVLPTNGTAKFFSPLGVDDCKGHAGGDQDRAGKFIMLRLRQ